ncbi:MAG: metal-dependent transcriptional regulator [Verrucomicrobia bacterium]|nr:metal-dependent transcriptional regulator [Verrucomicrobiota bacterium]
MPSTAVENYIKEIYLLSQRQTGELVLMGDIAKALQVAPGTATTMMKSLAAKDLVEYESRVGVRLSPTGLQLALQIVRKHRILEYFLVETLGLDWSEIHHEAELLEHAVSERVLEALDAFLGRPQFDPHGDPIPDAAGGLPDRSLRLLAKCEVGQTVEIARLDDRDAEFLQFAEGSGLKPGLKLRVAAISKMAGVMSLMDVAAPERMITLGMPSAARISVHQDKFGGGTGVGG